MKKEPKSMSVLVVIIKKQYLASQSMLFIYVDPLTADFFKGFVLYPSSDIDIFQHTENGYNNPITRKMKPKKPNLVNFDFNMPSILFNERRMNFSTDI